MQMKIKIKTKGNNFKAVKLKCSAVEFLIIKRALRNTTQDRCASWTDRVKALAMIEDIEKGVKDARANDRTKGKTK